MSRPTRVTIIGAGIAGLVTAKTYLQVCKHLNRQIELVVLDEGTDLGGVWSTQRQYPGLSVQAPNGYYEFSDMTIIDEEHPWDSFTPASHEQAYLEAYARKFDVYDKIRFATTVVKVRKRDMPSQPGWIVETAAGEIIECDKLVVASGLYSKHRPVPIPTSDFTGTSIHSRYLSLEHERLSKDPTVKDVVVVGACKSAVEACSVFLAAKKRVHWVVRPSDQGAPLIIYHPDKKPSPLAITLTRMFTIFVPSMWSASGLSYDFLHSGKWWLGTWLVQGVIKLMSQTVNKDIQYEKSQNGMKIRPKRESLFFYTSYLSLVVEGAPFFDALHKDNPEKLMVHRATPLKCESRELIVDDEEKGEVRIPADAVIWSIGWDPALDFFGPEDAAELGCPMNSSDIGDKTAYLPPQKGAASTSISTTTPTDPTVPSLEVYDQRTRKLFPATLNQNPAQPQDPTTSLTHSRWGLYRFTIPSKHFADGDRTLAFSGMISSGQTVTTSEIGALWAVAWLEDLFTQPPMPLLDKPDVERLVIPSPWLSNPQRQESLPQGDELKLLADAEIRFNQAFQERRYGLRGARAPQLNLEARSYIDLLCRDLGVEVQRKRTRMRERNGGALPMEKTGLWGGVKNWFREYFEPYLAPDYKGIVEEFLRNRAMELARRD